MNGVVVITTKKGKKGAPRINYTGNFTIRTKPRYSNYDIMNSADQMAVTSEIARKGMLNESILNSSSYGPYGLMWKAISTYNKDTGKFDLMNTRSAREAFLLKYAKANTDWFDELFTHNLQQEHTLSISTGSDKSRTYASIGFLRDDGWSVADEVSRYTLNFRNDYTVSEKISVGVQAVASFRDQSAPGSYSRKINSVTGEWSREFDINPFSYALNTSRAVRPYDDNGNLEYVQMNYAPFNIFNELENNKRGIYGGAIGYLDFTGNMDTCIAIRLAFKKNGKVFVRSGAGIVADSVPEKEHQECINKAKAVMVALAEAEGGSNL